MANILGSTNFDAVSLKSLYEKLEFGQQDSRRRITRTALEPSANKSQLVLTSCQKLLEAHCEKLLIRPELLRTRNP